MIYLFDIDGTILLTGGAGSKALNQVFAELHDLQGAMDKVHPGGKTDPLIIEEVFETRLGRKPTAAEIDAVIEGYLPRLKVELDRSDNFRLMPQVVEVLDFLAADNRAVLGIATGNVREAADAKLDRAGLRGRFCFGGYGCDHRDRWRLVAAAIERARALDQVAGDLERTVIVVGDTPSDIRAARAVGAEVVAVATGSFSLQELAGEQPDQAFATLAELPAWHSQKMNRD